VEEGLKYTRKIKEYMNYTKNADGSQKKSTGQVNLSYTEETHVKVNQLTKHFPINRGIFGNASEYVPAVDNVSFEIPKGKTFGLVGESGSGKTTIGKTILRLHEPTSGDIWISGTNVTSLSEQELRNQRREMQMIFQDPTSSLNPRKRVRDILIEPLRVHNIGTATKRRERVMELMEEVNLPEEYLYKYPTALSGGQKQRVGIARAISLNPDFLVLDEPTSALDVSVQATIINLLEKVQNRYSITYLFISHDLSLIKNVSDWIGVLYLGELAEIGPTERLYNNPSHPYTRSLLSAIPTVDDADEQYKPAQEALVGEIPDPLEKPSGCPFRTRCPEFFKKCADIEPSMYKIEENHYASCILHDKKYESESPD